MDMINELKERLKKGEVMFTYTKKDGTQRQARGTTNQDIAGSDYIVPSGTGTPKTGSVPYWDLDKNAWRAFCDDSLVSIDS